MSTQPSDTREPVAGPPSKPLDFGWWASDAPTGGYLLRRVLEAAEEQLGVDAPLVRHVHLQVLRYAAAGPVDITVDVDRGLAATARATFSFRQEEQQVAVASMTIGAERFGPTEPGDTAAPKVRRRTDYLRMKTPSATLPPVTARFVYRPTGVGDGSVPTPGWDQVWVTPTDPDLRGRALIASIVDCWYPPSFMRAVNASLRDRQPVVQPPQLALLTAAISFPADEQTYKGVRHVLLANQFTGAANGYYFEHSQLFSDRGELLATAELVRTRALPDSA